MLQKCYKYEIIESLLKKKNHIRGLAKELKTNQTTIARKIRELFNENVVDYQFEGKNKVYFLKKSLEAFQNILIVENYKLIKILNEYPNLRNTIQKIKQDKRIKLAILFGSYAKHLANKNSDIDIFVETKNREIKNYLEKLNTRISVKIGKFDINNRLIKEIERNYVIIKGVELYYENVGFFEKTE